MKREEFEALLSLVGSELSGTQWAAIQGARLIAEVLQTISESLEVLADEEVKERAEYEARSAAWLAAANEAVPAELELIVPLELAADGFQAYHQRDFAWDSRGARQLCMSLGCGSRPSLQRRDTRGRLSSYCLEHAEERLRRLTRP